MKNYLVKLCKNLDILFTHDLEESNNWEKLVIEVLLNHISEFQNNTGGDIDLLLEDMKNAIKS